MENALMFVAKRVVRAWALSVGAVIWLALWNQPAVAQTVYNYTGNNFTLFSCGPYTDPVTHQVTATADCSTPAPTNTYTSYTATDHVTATLSFSAPLSANLSYQNVKGFAGFTLSLYDGHQTLNSETYPGGTVVELSTDSNGQISTWRIIINSGGANNGGIATQNAQFHADSGTLACCDPTVSGNLALNFSMPGTWGAISPSAAVTNLINLVNNPSVLLTNGQKSSLTDKLNNALDSIQAGLNKQAKNQLESFINAVQTYQKNNKISTATADTLINAARAIIATL